MIADPASLGINVTRSLVSGDQGNGALKRQVLGYWGMSEEQKGRIRNSVIHNLKEWRFVVIENLRVRLLNALGETNSRFQTAVAKMGLYKHLMRQSMELIYSKHLEKQPELLRYFYGDNALLDTAVLTGRLKDRSYMFLRAYARHEIPREMNGNTDSAAAYLDAEHQAWIKEAAASAVGKTKPGPWEFFAGFYDLYKNLNDLQPRPDADIQQREYARDFAKVSGDLRTTYEIQFVYPGNLLFATDDAIAGRAKALLDEAPSEAAGKLFEDFRRWGPMDLSQEILSLGLLSK